ncbi:hypothetical protein QL093DRAFT_1386167 [Fusarium oxysporum]|nr:hypothetical protein QL093DRAFT_1386167 [Fusarium oxysporum]
MSSSVLYRLFFFFFSLSSTLLLILNLVSTLPNLSSPSPLRLRLDLRFVVICLSPVLNLSTVLFIFRSSFDSGPAPPTLHLHLRLHLHPQLNQLSPFHTQPALVPAIVSRYSTHMAWSRKDIVMAWTTDVKHKHHGPTDKHKQWACEMRPAAYQ